MAKPVSCNGNGPGLEHEELYEKVTALIREYLIHNKDKSQKVIDFKQPGEIRKLVDLQLRDEGVDDDKLLELCKTVMKYSVNTRHPHFFNQLFTGGDEIGLIALFVTAATNTSMYTFEMAPVFSMMEAEVLRKMREFVGWEGGKGDGIFAPGGSISNVYGLLLARYNMFPQSKTEGVHGLPRLAFFCSEQAHYSNQKAAFLLGIGTEYCIKVKCDSRGKMIPEELEREITEAKGKGVCPIAVVATAATTVTGAFDPLLEVAAICKKHSIWMHVDGCLGGSVLLSRKYRGIAAGIELADSVAWNPHKSLCVPQQCSAFLTRHEGLLKESNSTHASYLFQQDKLNYDVTYDTGDKSLQCGRLNDVFKLWLKWKQKGSSGFERVVDQGLEMSGYLTESIKKREGFQLVLEKPEYTNVCFWYFPPKMRELYPFPVSDQVDQLAANRLTKVAPIIKLRMVQKGSIMFTYQPLKSLPNFFRMALITPTTQQDIDWLLNEIEVLGEDICIE